MAIHLMTGTGTQADVNAALGIAAGSAPDPEAQGVGPVAGSAEAFPTPKAAEPPVVEEPATDPAEAPPEPPADAPPTEESAIPDSEFDPETGEPITERAARSPRSKLQTIKHLRKRAQGAEAERETFRERAARLEGELAAYKAGLAPPPATPPAAPHPVAAAPDPDAPKEADYETYEDYIRAVTAHETRKTVRATLDAERQTRAAEQARSTIQSRIATFREAHPDYDDAINSPDLKITDAMAAVLTDPENEYGPAVAYALAKDPARCARIAAMPPPRAIKEMGILEAEVRVPSAKPAPASVQNRPSVPPPPTPIRGGSAPAVRNLDDVAKSGDVKAFMHLRNAQEQARRAR